MRGKQGEKLTQYGDIFYDYAKIYQSLIGYDEILENKFIDDNYKNKMLKSFEDYFIEKFSLKQLDNLKNITKSLLFTLLPLHEDKVKCLKYYELINSLK